MKICTKCLKEKSLKEFGYYNKSKGRIRSDCKECYRLLKKVHYANNKSKYQKSVKEKRATNREFVKKFLSNKNCLDCGVEDWRLLEFDHVRGIKAHNISHMIDQMFSLTKITAEIEKCDVVCANCHRLRSYGRQENCYRVH